MAAIITPIFLPNISPQQYSIEESNLISSFQINTSKIEINRNKELGFSCNCIYFRLGCIGYLVAQNS